MKMISTSREASDDRFAHISTYWKPGSLETHALGFIDLAAVGARHSRLDDCAAPAIMYCIRHAVELFIKHAYQELRDAHNLPPQELVGHELVKRWHQIIRPLVLAALDQESENGGHANFSRSTWLAAIDDIVKQIDAVDPDGQTTRYPRDTTGNAHMGVEGTLDLNFSQLERFSIYVNDVFTQFRCRCA